MADHGETELTVQERSSSDTLVRSSHADAVTRQRLAGLSVKRTMGLEPTTWLGKQPRASSCLPVTPGIRACSTISARWLAPHIPNLPHLSVPRSFHARSAEPRTPIRWYDRSVAENASSVDCPVDEVLNQAARRAEWLTPGHSRNSSSEDGRRKRRSCRPMVRGRHRARCVCVLGCGQVPRTRGPSKTSVVPMNRRGAVRPASCRLTSLG